MNEKEKFSPPMVGGSSLLVIFAVLCLTIFAMLSLSTVQAGSRLGNSAAKAVTDYYEADCEAEKILAKIRLGECPAEVEKFQENLYVYSCPISETQTLVVEVRVEGENYTILRWQAVSVGEWEPEEDLTVWDGETMK